VLGVDVAPVEALGLSQVSCLEANLADPALAERILGVLGGPADVVLSDAAPKLTGIRVTDRAREEELLESVAGLLAELLRPGGDLLLKTLEGPEAQAIVKGLRSRFAKAKTLSPSASRKGTTERYLVARDFKG
jgi:23S rRNA (uridine2552-2'-O)-methyltransferase